MRPPQWDKVENKTTVVLYGAGGLVAVWFSSTLVAALNAIPVVSCPPLTAHVGNGQLKDACMHAGTRQRGLCRRMLLQSVEGRGERVWIATARSGFEYLCGA